MNYHSELRSQESLISDLLQKSGTQVFLVSHGKVAVPQRARGAKVSAYRLAFIPGTYVSQELAHRTDVIAMYMGSALQPAETSYIALDISRTFTSIPNSAQVSADNGFGETVTDFLNSEPASGDRKQNLHIIDRASERFDWVDLRDFAPLANSREAGLATSAVSLGTWNIMQNHCQCCDTFSSRRASRDCGYNRFARSHSSAK